MRHFHKQKNHYHCPIVNLDKLWALVGEEVSRCRNEMTKSAAGTSLMGSNCSHNRRHSSSRTTAVLSSNGSKHSKVHTQQETAHCPGLLLEGVACRAPATSADRRCICWRDTQQCRAQLQCRGRAKHPLFGFKAALWNADVQFIYLC